jgi:hypothetical protein
VLRKLALGGAVLALAVPARAELVFEKTAQTVPAQWSDPQVTAGYKFRNTGSETVKVTKLTSSCGCTVGILEKTTYAPGETGEVRVVFTVDGRTGPQQKTVTIATDLPGQPAVELAFATDIPEPVKMQPAVVYWDKSDADPKGKAITLEIAPGVPLEKIETAVGAPFRATLQEVEPKRRYTLTVVPAPSDGPAKIVREEIVVLLRLADGRTLRRTGQALVR